MNKLELEIKKELDKQLAREARIATKKELEKSFMAIKKEMIDEFIGHPITRELKAGEDADNISGTLGGITNLYSFIGFEAGYDPIAPILELLEQTNFRFISLKNPRGLDFAVDLVTARDIFDKTPMPFMNGRSWAKGIENGISGLNYYLKKKSPSSRSGLGIQTEQPVRKGVKFKNTKYISEIITKYTRKFRKLTI